MRSSVRQALGLAGVSGLLFFAALGNVDLWDEDEPTFAGAAREMLARGEWIVPYFNGQMLPDKPVLSYWVMIAGYKLLGETELAARAGSALFSVGTVLLTWLLGRRMFSPRAGLWAGLMLASNLSFLVVARAATPDAVLTFFCTLAMLSFVWSLGPAWPGSYHIPPEAMRWPGQKPRETDPLAPTHRRGDAPVDGLPGHRRDGANQPKESIAATLPQPPLVRGNASFPTACSQNAMSTRPASSAVARTLALTGSYAAMGVAVLAKGPIGVLLPMVTIGLYSVLAIPHSDEARSGEGSGWFTKRLLFSAASRFSPRRLFTAMKSMHLLLAVVIVLAVAGPWYAAVGMRTDGAWLSGFFGKHNLERFLRPMEHHRGPFFYYPLSIIVGFFPWSLFLGPAAVFIRSQLRARSLAAPAYCLLLCWVAAYLVFFSLAATKLPNYIVPVYPALALLTGAWLDAWLSGACVVRPFLLRVAWTALAVVGLIVSIALPLVVDHYFGGGAELAVIGLPLVAGGLLCWWLYMRRGSTQVMTAFAASTILFWLAVFGYGSVEVGSYQTSRLFADAIRRHSLTTAPEVRTFGFWRPSLVYYLGRRVETLQSPEQVRAFCRRWPRSGFLLVSGDKYAALADLVPHDVTILERGAWFLKKKELFLLGRNTVETPLGTVAWRTSPSR